MTGSDQLDPVALIVDDEPGICQVASRFIQQWGFQVITARGGREAIDLLQNRRIDVVMVDLRMPEVDGLGVLSAIRDSAPDTRAILMTGHTTEETRLEAVKLGALDYLPKPLDWRYLEQRFASIRSELERRQSIFGVETELARRLEFAGMIGRSAVMTDLFEFIRRLAPYARVALITGETGTGKELVARALHDLGPRRDRRFVALNCSAVVETLFESELFGHVRGAFTGAVDHKAGMFEQAAGGTIFLDEIGELPLSVQAKLLRVLEQGEVYRVGSVEPRRVDVHVIAATNRDLRAAVNSSRFRSDLFYRLNVVEIQVPPLRVPAGGHPVPDGILPARHGGSARQDDSGHHALRRAPPGRRRLAGQRSRAAERDRARLHPGRQPAHHRARAPAEPAGGFAGCRGRLRASVRRTGLRVLDASTSRRAASAAAGRREPRGDEPRPRAARPRARRREQEARRRAARRQSTGLLPSARPPRSRRHGQTPESGLTNVVRSRMCVG